MAKRKLRLWEALALSLGLMGPTLAMAGNGQGIIGTVGKAVPLVFLLGFLGVAPVAYGFIRLTQRYNHAGSAYALVGATLGPRAGFVAGFALFGTYLFFTICTAAVFGAFLNALLASLAGEGTSLGYGIAAVACLLITAYMNTRDTTTVSRSLLTIEGVGIAAMLVLVVAVFGQGGADTTGVDFSTFTPDGVGLSAVLAAVVAAFLSWAGFEACAALGEETDNPRRNIPRALFGSVLLTGVLFVVVMFAQTIGFGTDEEGLAAFQGSGNTLGDLGEGYVGHWFGLLLLITAVLSAFASNLSSVMASARLAMALARHGFGPRQFAPIDPTHPAPPHPAERGPRDGRHRHRGQPRDVADRLAGHGDRRRGDRRVLLLRRRRRHLPAVRLPARGGGGVRGVAQRSGQRPRRGARAARGGWPVHPGGDLLQREGRQRPLPGLRGHRLGRAGTPGGGPGRRPRPADRRLADRGTRERRRGTHLRRHRGALMHEAAERLYARDRIVAGVEKLRFFPLALESGEGSWLVEAGGRRLLDLSATWTACGLGHGRPAGREALLRAASAPPGAGALSAVHEDAVALAEELLDLVPGSGDRRVYFGHAGSDANDVAIRSAVHATGRPNVLAFEHSYHGGIGVAMKASGVHVDAGSVATDQHVRFTPYPDPYRAPERYEHVLV